MANDSPAVVFEELNGVSDFKIGRATLTKPAALNALDLNMITLLKVQLEKWHQDKRITMVFLDGCGDRAFCAGGDIVSLYQSMQQNQVDESNVSTKISDSFALQEFFTQEYQLDYLIHTYSKPVLVWGNGIVMGGGLGLMNGASHRIVTETSRIAMPEISIGLYPDVGGSHFLNAMPAGCGLFLGLTGASINAADALYSKLADYYVPHHEKAQLMARLLETSWQYGVEQTLSAICDDFHVAHVGSIEQGHLHHYQDWLTSLAEQTGISESVAYIQSADASENAWLAKAQRTLAAGSPVSAHLVFEQLKKGKDMTLAESFQMELEMSCKCGEWGEFKEGVRALLIDKDNQPNWRYQSVEQVPKAIIDYFFENIWPEGEHPLGHLAVV